MKKKQKTLTIIDKQGKFVAPNRKTARFMKSKGVEFTRLTQVLKKSDNSEFKQFRKDLAKEHGSKTGKLKGKHSFRHKKHEELLLLLNEGHKFEVEDVIKMGYSEEQALAITGKE